MAISTASDLVFDVLKAADPQRSKLARAKLEGAAGTENFAVAMGAAETGAHRVRDLPSDLVLDVVRAADPARARAGAEKLMATANLDARPKAYEQLEAFFLGQVMETMLPREEGGVFGAGTAGGIWRSMLAQELGSDLAENGGLGVAAMIAGGEDKTGSVTAGNDIVPAPGWPYFRLTPGKLPT
jgi:hypothetical protein